MSGVCELMPLVHAGEVELVLVPEGEMRGRGVPESTGEYIALFGARYVACHGWASTALKVSADVTCGCVHPPQSDSRVDWAIYLAEYSHLAPPMPSHSMTEKELLIIPEGNVVYARPVAERAIHAELRPGLLRAGHQFYFEPELAVRYQLIPGLAEYLRQRYRESSKWAIRASRNRTAAYRYAAAISRLALPILLLLRRGRNVAYRKRYRGNFLIALPLLLLFGIVEAAGEIAGFLNGARE